jgi:hypothetical protein
MFTRSRMMLKVLALLAALLAAGCTYTITEDDPMLGERGAAEIGGGGDTPNGWAQSGTLTTGNSQGLVSFQCKGLERSNYTVTITSTQPSTGATTEALVTWTVAGTDITRRITVPGSLTGAADAVRVQVVDATDVVSFPSFVAGKTYPVTIAVAKGTRGPSQMPPVLIPGATGLSGGLADGPGLYIIQTATIDTIPIPQGVGIVSVMVNAVALGTGVVADSSNAQISMGVSGFGIQVGSAPANVGAWLPVPPGATVLGMRNISGQPLWFSVTFGIDG